jgi:hypothetical protein
MMYVVDLETRDEYTTSLAYDMIGMKSESLFTSLYRFFSPKHATSNPFDYTVQLRHFQTTIMFILTTSVPQENIVVKELRICLQKRIHRQDEQEKEKQKEEEDESEEQVAMKHNWLFMNALQ